MWLPLPPGIEMDRLRSLWLSACIMVVGGLTLMLAEVTAALGPIALVGGLLLFWSGSVKLVVLGFWHRNLTKLEACDADCRSPVADNSQ
jgi:hypothetical protein